MAVAPPITEQDPRFNPDVDKHTGYKTKNILCMPVKAPDGEVSEWQFSDPQNYD